MAVDDEQGYCLLMFGVILLAILLVIGSFAYNYMQDTRQYDSSYCRDYAQWIDLRIGLNPEQAINVGIAKRVCECQWHPLPENSVYSGYTECWRR